MRFMMLVYPKGYEGSAPETVPDPKHVIEMGKYNQELTDAGVLRAMDGLDSPARGARVTFDTGKAVVRDGPFTETKELIAGFWLLQVRSKEECIEWVKRCPNPMEGASEIEIRQVFDADDFGEALTPELRAQEERMRAAGAKIG